VDPLDPKLVADVAARAKELLRKRMKALRGAYPAQALALRSSRIVERVAALPEFVAARNVALFWPMLEQNEVDLRELDARARAEHKGVYYPGFRRSAGGVLHTELRACGSPAELSVRGQRFFEPPPQAPAAGRGDVDLVIVPALAAALSGHRLGFGLGFYDSLLPDFRPPARAVIVAFDFQLLAEVPVMPHDVRCDLVVSDARAVSVDVLGSF